VKRGRENCSPCDLFLRAERKSRSRKTAPSKTDVMILRLLLPHNASSDPWSSPPSLTALRRLANPGITVLANETKSISEMEIVVFVKAAERH